MKASDGQVITLNPVSGREIQIFVRDCDLPLFISILNREIDVPTFSIFGVDMKTTYILKGEKNK